jgi:hypothetical protein
MSKKLTLGGNGLTWSNPSGRWIEGQYVNRGVVWMGLKKATEKDIQAAADFFGVPRSKLAIDKASLVGRHHQDWNSHFYEVRRPSQRPGGLGSKTYELQKVGEGVEFAKRPIFHFDAKGNYERKMPGKLGEHHKLFKGDTNDAYVGPRTGSVAAKRVAGKEFYFDAKRGYYNVRKPRNKN